jgi:hypothetical protein
MAVSCLLLAVVTLAVYSSQISTHGRNLEIIQECVKATGRQVFAIAPQETGHLPQARTAYEQARNSTPIGRKQNNR